MKYLILLLPLIFILGCNPANESPAKNVPSTGIVFSDKTSESKVDFTHYGGASKDKWLPEVMGGGVSAVDVNNDGNTDLIFVGSGDFDKNERP